MAKGTLEERLHAGLRIDPDTGCWEWQRASDRHGYGHLWAAEASSLLTHRISYELFVGPIPPGTHVCHRCDNPPCCNPDHLWLGDDAANARDRDRKGRQIVLRGARSGMSKLTDDAVREIRTKAAAGESQGSLARRFGVTRSTVTKVVHGRTWRHVI